MRSLYSIAVSVSLALIGACGTNHNVDQQEGTNNDQGGPADNGTGGGGSGSGSSAAACPIGAPTFGTQIAQSFFEQRLNMAVDASDNVLLAGSFDAVNYPSATAFVGIDEISAMGKLTSLLSFGSLVATDAQGDIFVAGSFTSRIDFGNGLVLDPMGNIDVFIAKLDAKGHVVFAKDLGLCGDGAAAMVVAKDGRIAISGSAMGTVVLAANGDMQFTVAEFGQIAFDSTGDLVIAGSSTQVSLAFLEMVDASGVVVFDNQIQGTARISAVTFDMNDNIVLVGDTTATVDLFGTTITAQFAIEPGRITGAFLAVLDKTCAVQSVRDLGIVEANGVAIDANGQIFVAGAIVADNNFDRYIEVVKVDVRGIMSVVDLGIGQNVNGRADAIAVDACGSVFVALVRSATPSAASEEDAFVLKLAI